MKNRFSDRKIVLIKRKTPLEELISRFNTMDQARFYIEHLGGDFSDYQTQDWNYRNTIMKLTSDLLEMGNLQILDREHVPNFIFGKDDVIVATGQDGLVANTLKYLDGQPLIGVNPDPGRWDGVLLPFTAEEVQKIMPEVLKDKRDYQSVTMAKADLNDGQTLYAVNDFFIGQQSHVSARYEIQFQNQREMQSSSGIIISTGLGSTGWMAGVMAGMKNMALSLTGSSPNVGDMHLNWDSDKLLFAVREPYPSKTTGSSLVFGTIQEQEPLTIRSFMAERGVIFSDGLESDYLEFNSGVQAVIGLADKKGILIV